MRITRDLQAKVLASAQTWDSITITGPRQAGKTTLCEMTFPTYSYVSLENPDTRQVALNDPRAFLDQYSKSAGVIIDEVQRVPQILSYLQGYIDENPKPGHWILTGSQNLDLLQSINQSLAGRTITYELLTLTRNEVERFPSCPESLDETLLTGGYPRLFDRALNLQDWYRTYVSTYIERDVRSLLNIKDLSTFQRFIQLCAGRTAQLLNYSSIGNDCGISQPTVKAWLELLETSYIVFRLPATINAPSGGDLKKMPKLHFYDSGLVCWLLGIHSPEHLRSHPLRGSIFESWVISELIRREKNQQQSVQHFAFFRNRRGLECDMTVHSHIAALTTLLEAKSSSTFSNDWFGDLDRAQEWMNLADDEVQKIAVFGGEPNNEHLNVYSWENLDQISFSSSNPSVLVLSNGQPVPAAHVHLFFPNNTWKTSSTSMKGEASFELYTTELPMTVWVAHEAFRPVVRKDWVPSTNPLTIELDSILSTGSVVFEQPSGTIPGLIGTINPIHDNQGRSYVYTNNIAVNDGAQRPHHFKYGEELIMTDSEGNSMRVRILDIRGGCCILEFSRQEQTSPPS